MASTPNPESGKRRKIGHFRTIFIRGLGILLPTVLTIWILLAAYQFVDDRIAGPLNEGIRKLVILSSPWPEAERRDYAWAHIELLQEPELSDLRAEWAGKEQDRIESLGRMAWARKAKAEGIAKEDYPSADDLSVIYVGLGTEEWTRPREDGSLRKQELDEFVRPIARERALERWWSSVTIGTWEVMDLFGLLVAIILIYLTGRLVGSFIGRRLYARGEEMLQRVPLFKQVYPYVKQVTDFLFGDETKQLQFSNVVAVQYPRIGIWSVGFVTGDTMRAIQEEVESECITIFVPSSPTPFTGYVITVPREETVNLPISIDEALRFAVSGGVIIPTGQRLHGTGKDVAAEAAVAAEASKLAKAKSKTGETSGTPGTQETDEDQAVPSRSAQARP